MLVVVNNNNKHLNVVNICYIVSHLTKRLVQTMVHVDRRGRSTAGGGSGVGWVSTQRTKILRFVSLLEDCVLRSLSSLCICDGDQSLRLIVECRQYGAAEFILINYKA